jgi:alkylation response protein AidB-like acyl-CoA dehydrogenase
VFDGLVELGVMGLTVPEEHAGAGRDIVAAMACIEELSKHSLAIAVPYIMSACYAGMNLSECGSDTQKRDLLPKVALRGLMFAYGWSEPDVGADVASVKTSVRREGDELVVDGAKRFCTGADICDYIFVLCRSDATQPRYQNLSIVLVPPTALGVEISRIDSLGLRGPATTDVVFNQVRVPAENLFGGPDGWGRGWSLITGSGLDVEKLEFAAMALGIDEAAFSEAWRYAEQRRQFGQAILAYQSIRHKLADMATQLHGSRLMLYHAARLSNLRIRCGVETSMAKLFAAEAAKSVALEAQTILGAYGYVKEFCVERLVRDALLMPIIGGSSAIQKNNIVNWAGSQRG